MLNELARLRLANLGRKPGSNTLPSRKIILIRCSECGLSVPRTRWTKHCRCCEAMMTPKSSSSHLCRLCDEPCPGRRYSWCSDECEAAYLLATNSSFLRQATFERDKGICALCGTDCEALQNRVNVMHYEQRGEAYAVLRENGFNAPFHRCSSCSSLWDADHVEPLDEGGSWELSNVQTLCHPCHKEKTAEQATRRGTQLRMLGKKWRRTQEMLRLSQGGER